MEAQVLTPRERITPFPRKWRRLAESQHSIYSPAIAVPGISSSQDAAGQDADDATTLDNPDADAGWSGYDGIGADR
jgi:hypothetical protein